MKESYSITQEEVMPYIIEVSKVFTPTAPVSSQMLFAGRMNQIQKVISAVVQLGQHVIMFGERGVGKTSLANVIFDFFKTAGFQSMESGTINCDATMDFSSLWHKILRDMAIEVKGEPVMGFTADSPTYKAALNSGLPQKVTPDDVRHLLQMLPVKSVIVIDELDRLNKNSDITALLADTIKTLSDHSVNCTLILVGVADNVDELIAEHRSIERALLQIQMPRMLESEIVEILDKCFSQTRMIIAADAKEVIVKLSRGLPHFTHLLGLHSCRVAINRLTRQITIDDVKRAIKSALENSQSSILSTYHKAISSPRDNLYTETLLACALAKTDFLGYFSAVDVKDPLSAILHKPCDIPVFGRHLNAFCNEDRGKVLQRFGEPRRYRYRFTNPLLQPFVILKGIDDGLIDEKSLGKF